MAGNRSLGHPAAALLALFVILAGTLLVAAPAAGASNQETTAEFSTVSVITEGEFRVIPAEIWFSLIDSNGNVVWEGPAGEQEFVLASSGDPHTLTATARTDIGDFSVQMKSIVFDGSEYSRVELRFAYVWAMEGVAIVAPAFLALSALKRIRMSLRGPRRGPTSAIQGKKGKKKKVKSFDYFIAGINNTSKTVKKNGKPIKIRPSVEVKLGKTKCNPKDGLAEAKVEKISVKFSYTKGWNEGKITTKIPADGRWGKLTIRGKEEIPIPPQGIAVNRISVTIYPIGLGKDAAVVDCDKANNTVVMDTTKHKRGDREKIKVGKKRVQKGKWKWK